MKYLKVTILTSLIILAALIIFIVVVFSIPRLNEADLKSLINNETGVIIDEKIHIIEYENTGLAISDFGESYTVKLTLQDYEKFKDKLKAQSWENLEKGYQLLIRPETVKTPIYIFFLSKDKPVLNIKIIEE